ncbi:TolB-like translocation protein [Alkaliphilus peptidifermentans]|uniref:Uncharacterized protein n=1 Tax=Alkaliphilus peptidifermentans DSM 18978 TaxID=1120976 RepID=A0A1G5FLD7_9FIRM|nr:hypothetical protein [Alkaliphilus peptidifermentans]SCY40152.1 hypothetical protein SAMN03080606_01461 [Alkaliphilus peptidifermentans DSM 18978]
MKKFTKLFILIGFTIILVSCGGIYPRERPLPQEGLALEEAIVDEGIRSKTGVDIANGKFYFTGMTDTGFNYYMINSSTMEKTIIFEGLENYDWFTPLMEEEALYVDYDGALYILSNGEGKQMEENITGTRRPNVVVSPDRKAVLYTKDSSMGHQLYLYDLNENNAILIKEALLEDEFLNFLRATHWSNHGDYFILNNEEIYDRNGSFIAQIEALSLKWSPNDEWIAYIASSPESEKTSIIIGDRETFIGTDFCLFSLVDYSETVIYSREEGLINPIDAIQWNESSSRVAIAVGTIKMIEDYYEGMDYKEVLTYDIASDERNIIEKMPYNYYEFIFDDYLYVYNLGKREALVIMNVISREKIEFDAPLLLNSKDMFIITNGNLAYLINNNQLMEFTRDGEYNPLFTFPWPAEEVHYDSDEKQFIIINTDNNIYWLK